MELLCCYKLSTLVLVVDDIYSKIDYDGTFRMEAQGFQGDIWLLLEKNTKLTYK